MWYDYLHHSDTIIKFESQKKLETCRIGILKQFLIDTLILISFKYFHHICVQDFKVG